jgi:hypothetical protein
MMRSGLLVAAVRITIGTSPPARSRRQSSKPSTSGKAEVEHDDARRRRSTASSPRRPCFTDDLEARLLEVRADERADRVVVLDHDGNAAHGLIA